QSMSVGRSWGKRTVEWSCTATSGSRDTSCASGMVRRFTFGGAGRYGRGGVRRVSRSKYQCSRPQVKMRRTLMPASIQASAISHIALCVRDLECSLQFYRDGLGFQVTKDEVQDTSRGGLPHLYHDRHGQRRV